MVIVLNTLVITDPQATTYHKSPSIEHYIGRYAPSPTGPLHFGSLIAALASYLDAKHHHGKWHLRIDDIDHQRCKPEHTIDILQTLEAFGFEWDGEIQYQQQRINLYQQALEALKVSDLVFACECSRKMLPPGAYPGTCLNRTNISFENHAVRIKTHGININIEFEDGIQGNYHEDLSTSCGDFVVYRADGMFSYHLASVVDDAELGVNQIVRGADLLDSTARQIYLQQCLGYATPIYSHIPVVVNQAGEKLSKQTFAEAVKPTPQNEWLISALQFLGQTCPEEYTQITANDVLLKASARWQRNLIVQSRSKSYPVNKAS